MVRLPDFSDTNAARVNITNFSTDSLARPYGVSPLCTLGLMDEHEEDLLVSPHGFCPVCGADCDREFVEGDRIVVAFVCDQHGVTGVVDLFSD